MVALSSVVLLLWICQFKACWWTNKQRNKQAHDHVTIRLEYIDVFHIDGVHHSFKNIPMNNKCTSQLLSCNRIPSVYIFALKLSLPYKAQKLCLFVHNHWSEEF